MPVLYYPYLCNKCKKEGYPDCRTCNYLDDIPIPRWAGMVLKKLGYHSKDITLTVRWDNKLTTAAGNAWKAKKLVKLSPSIFTDVKYKEIFQTLAHEICHVVCIGRGHGPEWKGLMGKLGLPARRCHPHKMPNRRKVTQRIKVICSVCNERYTLGPRQMKKHIDWLNRLPNGRGLYVCKCKGKLNIDMNHLYMRSLNWTPTPHQVYLGRTGQPRKPMGLL